MTIDVNRPLAGARLVEIHQDDTLQKIAARELGDANKWRDLILINSLRYPYLTGDANLAGPGIKLYGQMLAVPSSETTVSSIVDPDLVFKVDIKLDKGFLVEDGSGDVQLIGGIANYKQAIGHRIMTELKELVFHLGYGCGIRQLLGRVNGPTRAQLAASYVKSAVQADKRTASVKSSTARVIGDALVVEAVAEPIAGAAVSISQVFSG